MGRWNVTLIERPVGPLHETVLREVRVEGGTASYSKPLKPSFALVNWRGEVRLLQMH